MKEKEIRDYLQMMKELRESEVRVPEVPIHLQHVVDKLSARGYVNREAFHLYMNHKCSLEPGIHPLTEKGFNFLEEHKLDRIERNRWYRLCRGIFDRALSVVKG